MVFERKGVERVDPFGSMELLNSKFDGGLPKYVAIEIYVAVLQMKIFYPFIHGSLFAGIVSDAPRLTGSEMSGIYHRIWFEERPEQIVCDFVIFKEGSEAFGCGSTGGVHER